MGKKINSVQLKMDNSESSSDWPTEVNSPRKIRQVCCKKKSRIMQQLSRRR